MIASPFPLVLVAAMALLPLGAGQQARLAAWLEWGAAYRDCYAPAPFSLRIDEVFTARCIERTLRQEERGAAPQQRAATDALIVATPQLMSMLNTPVGRKSDGANARAGAASPPRSPSAGAPGNRAVGGW